ncbi:MAG: undecaprenyldiphospho-muramoylpentapeptide beta-N-acetylglucosaminyltransferase [Aeromicrobium sp.]
MRVLLAGGGTAGHTSPLLATADVLRARGAEITCLGTPRGLEVSLIPEAGYPLELVPPVPLPRRAGGELARLPVRLKRSVAATREVFDRVEPDVVVGFGGYVAVPAYLAARKRLPIVVHEGNARPGVANKLGSRYTTHVATSFPDTALPHATFTGLPIRRQIAELDRRARQTEARRELGLDADRPTLVVTGGSQGARRINHGVSGAARELADAGIQVLHMAGRVEEAVPDRRAGDPPYVVKSYLDRIELAYAAADFIVCRAGANTVTEVAVTGLPAAFVPLPIGNGEQALNAHPVVQAGGALLVDDDAFTDRWVAQALVPVLLDRDRLEQMSDAAAHELPRDADRRLADMVMAAADQGA